MDGAFLLVLGIAILLGLLALSFARPDAATVLVVFVVYSNIAVVAKRVHDVPEGLAASFVLLLLIPLVNYVVLQRKPIVFNGVLILMAGYLVLLIVSAAASANPAESAGRLLAYLLEGCVLYWLVINTVRTEALRFSPSSSTSSSRMPTAMSSRSS